MFVCRMLRQSRGVRLWSRTVRLCRASESRDKIAGVTWHLNDVIVFVALDCELFLKGTLGQKVCLFFTYCKILFKLTHVSYVAPPIITIKGAAPNVFMMIWVNLIRAVVEIWGYHFADSTSFNEDACHYKQFLYEFVCRCCTWNVTQTVNAGASERWHSPRRRQVCHGSRVWGALVAQC